VFSQQVIAASDFDLEKTLFSGQVFHWSAAERGFLGAISDLPVHVEQEGSLLRVSGADAESVSHYFALDHPLSEITRSFHKDPTMEKALEFGKGLRIIRQPIWECLGTFLTSAMKQVQQIRAMSLSLRKRFGQKLSGSGFEVYSYPEPEVLAEVSMADLLECRLGFRAKYLLQAAKAIANGEIDLGYLQSLPTEKVRMELCKLPGVGEKIANCVLLFAYQRLDAVPIDVWIGRVLKEVYFADRPEVSMRELKAFSAEYFGSYAGYAQQYLFHHWRMTYRRKND
jgi:N-glycosylase/DNA lyase